MRETAIVLLKFSFFRAGKAVGELAVAGHEVVPLPYPTTVGTQACSAHHQIRRGRGAAHDDALRRDGTG
eukprot:6186428-Pleurochrysis_carterae.AAC.1